MCVSPFIDSELHLCLFFSSISCEAYRFSALVASYNPDDEGIDITTQTAASRTTRSHLPALDMLRYVKSGSPGVDSVDEYRHAHRFRNCKVSDIDSVLSISLQKVLLGFLCQLRSRSPSSPLAGIHLCHPARSAVTTTIPKRKTSFDVACLNIITGELNILFTNIGSNYVNLDIAADDILVGPLLNNDFFVDDVKLCSK